MHKKDYFVGFFFFKSGGEAANRGQLGQQQSKILFLCGTDELRSLGAQGYMQLYGQIAFTQLLQIHHQKKPS